MKYCVMNKDGDLLAVVEADSEDDAIKVAASEGHKDACTAEEKAEHPMGRSGAQ